MPVYCVEVKRQSLCTFLFETGTLTNWLGCLFSELQESLPSLPPQHWHCRLMLWHLFIPGEPIQVVELSQKVLKEATTFQALPLSL